MPKTQNVAQQRFVRRAGVLIQKGLTNTQVQAALERVSAGKYEIAAGKKPLYALTPGHDNIRRYK